jgi:hypothetical protein
MPGNGEEPGERQPDVGEVMGYGRERPAHDTHGSENHSDADDQSLGRDAPR